MQNPILPPPCDSVLMIVIECVVIKKKKKKKKNEWGRKKLYSLEKFVKKGGGEKEQGIDQTIP